jgi:diguanylate cyclase (GGDEF)-like protein
MQTTAVEPEFHLAFVSSIRIIKQLDADLNQDVLRSRYNLLVNYDSFVSTLDKIKARTVQLKNEPFTAYLQSLDPFLKQAVITLDAQIDAKTEQVEQFKSRNAVLKNSLRYFPMAADRLIENCKRIRNDAFCFELTHFQRDVLVLNLSAGHELEEDIRQHIKLVRQQSQRLIKPLAEEAEFVFMHADTILQAKHDVDTMTASILSAPLPLTAKDISISYDSAHKEAMRRSGYYRTSLYALAILLLGYVFYSIARLKLSALTLEFQATHDALTGMANRILLYSSLETCIRNKHSEFTVLLLLDLDHFKEINDTLGHQAGDTVLCEVSKRLGDITGTQGMIARLGGDEFAILMPHMTHRDQAMQLATQILVALRRPVELTGLRLEISGSIGISIYPQHGDTPSQLMRCADVAMYLAKNNSMGSAIYDAELDQHNPLRLAIMTGLGQAIEKDQFKLHFQPKVSVATGKVTGFEALLRWHHPEHGMITPNQFIPLAEMSDFITPLTLWVVERSLLQIKHWRANGFDVSIAVNFSARNFLDDSLPQKLAELLDRHEVPHELLEVEVTESAMMADPTRSLLIMRKIHEMGLRLAIDDFGTGHSSLAYLQRLPIQSLKIDLSFVRSMKVSKDNEVIVQSTIQLAHNLGLIVIAEGVEDESTLSTLRRFGCDEVQGYFISHPVDGDQATSWLQSQPKS